MTRRNLFAFFAALAIAASIQAPGRAGQVRYISLATSSAGSTFSVVGTAMIDVINKNVPGVSGNIEITGGSTENIILASNNTVELSLSASDIMYMAINSLGSFEDKPIQGVKGVMGGMMNTMQVYVLANGPIKKMSDLRGKKISVGPPGSVGNDVMRIIMDAYGMEMHKDWQTEHFSHGDAAEALVDGNVDAVCIFTIVPNSPIMTAAASRPIRILDIDDAEFAKILAENPFFSKSSVNANSYSGQTDAVKNALGSATIMICNEAMEEDLIYNIVKALYNNTDELVKAYPQCAEWIPDNAYRGLEHLELHPGAIKYLKEIGKAK
ncbi:MAG: TAXI family TRAP transporter solute-binding subunit [Planctomycetes bacterium]|nr:TAXI family TRAP transporter solute-binding subunit [Planctomycetota bacterium]